MISIEDRTVGKPVKDLVETSLFMMLHITSNRQCSGFSITNSKLLRHAKLLLRLFQKEVDTRLHSQSIFVYDQKIENKRSFEINPLRCPRPLRTGHLFKIIHESMVSGNPSANRHKNRKIEVEKLRS